MIELVSYRRMIPCGGFYRHLLGVYPIEIHMGVMWVESSDDWVRVPATMMDLISRYIASVRYVYPLGFADLPYGHDYPPQGRLDIYYRMSYGFVNVIRFTLVVTDEGSYRLYTSIKDYDDPHIWRSYFMDSL